MPKLPPFTRRRDCLLLLLAAAPAAAQRAPDWLPLRDGSLELAAHWELLTDTTYGFEKRELVV